MAARTRRKTSDSGHSTPNPSPNQKVPKVVSMMPTMNFSVFSGTFASGTRTSAPTRMTSRPAARAPSAAEAMPLERETALVAALSPKVITMNATSRPSSKTDLYDSRNPKRSKRDEETSTASRAEFSPFFLVNGLFVVARFQTGVAHDGVLQPLQPEEQQERADDRAKHVEWDPLHKRGPQRRDQQGERRRGGERAEQRASPVDGDADDQDDGEGLHELTGGGEKCGSSHNPLHRDAPLRGCSARGAEQPLAIAPLEQGWRFLD